MSRNRDFSKFKRGQVWWLYENREVTEKKMSEGHVQAKSRPWLIMSCDESNDKSYILNVVPISQSSDPNFINHVSYTTGYENTLQVIECEQITTKDMKEFMDRGKYMYTLSETIITSVLAAINRQLGGELSVPNLEGVLAVIEKLAVAKAKQVEAQNSIQVNSVVQELGIRLADIFNVKLETPVKVTTSEGKEVSTIPITSQSIEAEPVEEAKEEVAATETPIKEPTPQTPKKPAPAKKKYNKWTDEDKLQYLVDSETMNPRDLAKKYHLNSTSIAIKYKSKFKIDLNM